MLTHADMRQPSDPAVDDTATFLQDPPSTTSQASSDCRLDCFQEQGELTSDYTAIRTQSRSSSADMCAVHHPSILQPISDIRLPPSMKSRGSSNSPDDIREVVIPGIRYPPSWGQHRSMSPQGASNKISEGFCESFHSAESHHGADYNVLSSIDPPKTKIMVSLTYQSDYTHYYTVMYTW